MKIFVALVIVMTVMSMKSAFAGPYMVCDIDSDHDSYLVKMNGASEIEVPAPLHYDLEALPVGEHHVEVKAKSKLWGVSVSTPFDFKKPALSVINISLTP